jgi:hypothetical protein
VSNVTQPQRHEPRLVAVLGARVFPGQREAIIQDRGRLGEAAPRA